MTMHSTFSMFLIVCISCLQNTHMVNQPSGTDAHKTSWKTGKKINEALQFARKNGYDSGVALLIDYSKHSGLKRAYLINPAAKQVTDSFLVSHGCGAGLWAQDQSKENPMFSNAFDSHCTSLGKFKIGRRGPSEWGIKVKYILHGLDRENSNALKRTIVLHGWEAVSDDETYPAGTPEGWGCPAFSNKAMIQIDAALKPCNRPVLLWAY